VKLKPNDSVSVVTRSVERAAEIDEAAEEAEEAAAEQAAVDAEGGATIDGNDVAVPSDDETAADAETEES
jgi:hypothetical protein